MHFDLCPKHAGPGECGCPICAFESYEAHISEGQSVLKHRNEEADRYRAALLGVATSNGTKSVFELTNIARKALKP